MDFNVIKELTPFLEELNKDQKVKIDYFISDEFPEIILGNVEPIKDVIDYSISYIRSNIKKEGSIKLDLNCMKYDEAVGLYLSIMTRDTRIKKEDLDLSRLESLVDFLGGNILVDNNPDKGIILMIDFIMEAIIED